jgi:two-component system, LytTR family, sensor kinase
MLGLINKPGIYNFAFLIGNFVFLLMLWYLGITIYILIGDVSGSLGFLYIFLTKYSWPNFLLVYVFVIWIIPFAFHTNKIPQLIMLSVTALAVYVFIRYLNNAYWDDTYGYSWSPENIKYKTPLKKIIGAEIIRGLEFILIGFSIRMMLDKIIQKRDKDSLEKDVRKSELAALRFQLNPHFLFNVFNNIYSMALSKSEKTPDALLKLSQTLRYILQQKDGMVPISEEIEHLNLMLEFEKIRYPDSVINFNLNISPDAKHTKVPAMLLFPFIENIFKHGEAGTEQNPVLINLSITKEAIAYTVTNPVKTSPQNNFEKSGTGLENLTRRLSILYPNRYELQTKKENNYFNSNLLLTNLN